MSLKIQTKIVDSNDNTAVNDIYNGTRTGVSERVYKTYQIADSVTDQQVSLDNVNGMNLVMIRSDKDITVKIGGTEATRALNLKASLTDLESTSTHAMLMLTVTSDTLLYISNSSGAVATVDVIIL